MESNDSSCCCVYCTCFWWILVCILECTCWYGKSNDKSFNLSNTGYEGKPITELSTDEATALISENGFFGVSQTSQRVANFVLSFSGDDLEKLEKGREGIIKGFEEAQEMWGGELPQISYDTQAKTLELIDAKIAELKGNTQSTEESEQ